MALHKSCPPVGADSLAVALQASRLVRIPTRGPFPILPPISLPLRFLSVLICHILTKAKMPKNKSLKKLPSLVTVAMSDKPCCSHTTPCSHTVKNTLWSKEETDNMPTVKTEQVTSGMKQGLSFQILSFCKKFKQ